MLTVVYYTDNISFVDFSHNLVLNLYYFLKQKTVYKDHEANLKSKCQGM
jgi:hypothetical protein